MKINEDLLPAINNNYNESTEELYSCDYINKLKEDKDYIIEYYDAGSINLTGGDAKVYRAPKKEGYTAYVLKPSFSGAWSDKFATFIPYNNTDGFGIRNESSTTYTWTVGAYILYIKK